ncbi:hypothetical protein LTR33_006444 [Friedmanniomyces endolithicus]|nr:hypothetical protein LTR33_006444 [Friedmanniomyces endolithicus]
MSPALCELPNELLANIAGHLLCEPSSLRSLARTSRHFQAIAEPILYRSIFFRTGAQLIRLQQSLASEPWRFKSVHTLDVRWKYLPAGTAVSEPDALADMITAAPNIEDLTIESPYCNNDAWRQATAVSRWSQAMDMWLEPIILAAVPSKMLWGPRPLQALKRLTLHLNGTSREFWTMEREYTWILAHPTLEDLHLSSINLPHDVSGAVHPSSNSPLKRLTLEEANVTLDGLRSVLSFPRALECLYIGENRYSHIEQAFPRGQRYNCLAIRDVEAFMKILRLQKHSLQSFTYISNEISLGAQGPGPRKQIDVDFSMFEALRKMSLSGCHERTMLTWCAQNKGPPCLEELTVDEYVLCDVLVDEEPPANQPHGFFKELTEAAPRLGQFDVTVTSSFDFSVPPMVHAREAAAVAGQYLAEKGCVSCFWRGPNRRRIVRPVLFGEVEPENFLMYVNDEDGFRVAAKPLSLGNMDGSNEHDGEVDGEASEDVSDESEDDDEMSSDEEGAGEEYVHETDEEFDDGSDMDRVDWGITDMDLVNVTAADMDFYDP